MRKISLQFFFMGVCAFAPTTGLVQAQDTTPPALRISNSSEVLLAQATTSDAALQAAIDVKDTDAIIRILNATPRDKRGSLATILLAAAQSSCNNKCDKQFAASLAALAFVSGGLSPVQQNAAIVLVRGAPGGLFIVERLLSNNLTGGYGFGPIPAFNDLIIAETPLQGRNQGANITQTSPQGMNSPN